MSTSTSERHRTSIVSKVRLDPEMIANLTSVRDELYKRVNDGLLSQHRSLAPVFDELFGGALPRSEQIRVLFFAAPLVRRIVLEAADGARRVGNTDVTFADVKSWLWWLDVMDPLCARMIDLHYFAALSIKETAAALDLPPAAILRELRFARSWLRIRVPSQERPD